MRSLIVSLLIALVVLLAIPPQVKSVEYTYQATRVSFWYPTFIQRRSEIIFSDNLLIATEIEHDWTHDRLRSAHFLCGESRCKSEGNPVAIAWKSATEALDASTRDIERFNSYIAQAQNKRKSMIEYLEKNSCEQIGKGPEKPAFACSESEAEEVATTTCIIRELGSKACEKGGKEVLDGDVPKFLKDAVTREGCGALVNEIIGEDYSILDKTIKKYTTELGITIISEIIGYFSNNLKEGFDWSVAALKAKVCIPTGVNLCRQKYVVWQEAASAHFAKFDQGIRWCNDARTVLTGAESEISRSESHLEKASTNQRRLSEERARLQQVRERKPVPHLLQTL